VSEQVGHLFGVLGHADGRFVVLAVSLLDEMGGTIGSEVSATIHEN
jgi:hypothetical protein